MKTYILKRLLLIIPMLLGISFILFVIMHLAPGDPVSIRYGLNPEVSESARANFSKMYDLDKPVLWQYVLWLGRFFSFDFGKSLVDDQSVMTKIAAYLPATILLQGLSLLLIFIISIPMGVLSGIKQNSIFDKVITVLVYIGFAMPAFWLALLLIYFFGYKLEWLPISGMDPWYTVYLGGFGRLKDLIWHLILPVLTTAFVSLASLTRYTRASVIEVMHENYILTARAKGLKEGRIVVHHILRNALLPIVTIVGLTLPVLISGSFVFET
ncbi:MAG: ABC transporter permease, partial [Candidatus Omnitrophica bacterium]|nr:ABC transporter permease [Candidatus Omnitrophota bacterium]